jgi:uncharacterized Zn-binding protein involved in type VI secretion
MPFAARVLAPTSHPGTITGPGLPTVVVGGRPAARVGDIHTCALPPTAGPHPPTPVARGSTTVLIGGRPAARVGDTAGCGAVITTGARSVIIGG